MKILNVKVKNVRSYKDLDISFSPYLNVINGKSDSGKSGLIKALMYAIRNYSTKKTILNNAVGESFVSLSDGKTEVRRIKDKGVNGYSVVINGEEKRYNAIAKDIPFEVEKVLNLSDTNIQQQRETYFLIDKPDGFISKKLNEVSGLSEIDNTLKLITTEINSINSNVREINNRIAEDKEKIEDTKWSINADIELQAIEKLEKEIDKDGQYTVQLEGYVQKYKDIQIELENLLPSSIIEEYKNAESLSLEVQDLNKDILRIKSIINSYKETKKRYDSCSILDLTEVEEIRKEMEILEAETQRVHSCIKSYTSVKNNILLVEENLTVTNNLIKEVSVCPLCNQRLE